MRDYFCAPIVMRGSQIIDVGIELSRAGLVAAAQAVVAELVKRAGRIPVVLKAADHGIKLGTPARIAVYEYNWIGIARVNSASQRECGQQGQGRKYLDTLLHDLILLVLIGFVSLGPRDGTNYENFELRTR